MGLGGILSIATPIISGLINKPKSPPTIAGQDPSTLPNIDIPGLKFGTGPKVKMPTLPENMPNLPENMPVLPKAQMWGQTTGEAGSLDALKAQGKLYQAMLDPNNPIFKNQWDAQDQLIQNDFLSGLRDSITANRREQARGRRGFMNPERMDEQVTGAVTQNAQKARLLARQQAMQNLGIAANGISGIASGYRDTASLENTRRNQYENDLRDRLSQIRGDITTRLGNTRADIGTRTDQSRQDVINALNLYRQNMGASNDAKYQNYALQSDYNSRMAGLAGAGTSAFLDALKNIKITQAAPSGGFVGPMPQTSVYDYNIFGG